MINLLDVWRRQKPITKAFVVGGSAIGCMYLLVRRVVMLPTDLVYTVDPALPYGPIWKGIRPPGLPTTARKASVEGAALGPISNYARSQVDDPIFVATLADLASTESYGARFGLPANNFEARCPQGYQLDADRLCTLCDGHRPNGNLITAWGAFQWNRDALRSLARSSMMVPQISADLGNILPWELTAKQEIEYPIQAYAAIWKYVSRNGGSRVDAARAIRLWHRTPTGANIYVSTGIRSGYPGAWSGVSYNDRVAVDRHLDAAGLLV